MPTLRYAASCVNVNYSTTGT